MLDAEASALIGLDRFNADPQYLDFSDRVNFPDGRPIDGSGYSIVIIDSGADLEHPFFGPDANGDQIADRIVHQQNFVIAGQHAFDTIGHGTLVASIAAGFHPGGDGLPAYSGIAPGANLIILKVTPGGASKTSLTHALEWVRDEVDGQNQFNIAAVNISLSITDLPDVTESFTVEDVQNQIRAISCNFPPEMNCGLRMWNALATIEENGVLIAASGGNSYGPNEQEGLGFPGADTLSVAVAGTWDDEDNETEVESSPEWRLGRPCSEFPSCLIDNLKLADRMVSFMQRENVLLDVLAPGAFIDGAGLNETFIDAEALGIAGSSFASPIIAGVAVLARQMADLYGAPFLGTTFRNNDDELQLNVGFRTLLKGTGVLSVDNDPWDPTPTVHNFSADDWYGIDSTQNTLVSYRRVNVVRDPEPDSYPTLAEIQALNPTLIIPAGAPELSDRPDQPTGLANRLVPPRVKNVTLSNQTAPPGGDSRTYSFADEGAVGSGEQLRTVPVSGVNAVTIEFTEPVTGLLPSHLTVTSALTGGSYSITQLVHTDETNIATWMFAPALSTDQVVLTLADTMTDVLTDSLVDPATGLPLPANRLNGDWINPMSLADTAGSMFPSGDNVPGGHFEFHFTVIAGDATRDNMVAIDDLNAVRNHFSLLTMDWTLGELNGNGIVDIDDLNRVRNNFGVNFTLWPGGGAQAAMAGPSAGQLTSVASEEAFFFALAQLYATESKESGKLEHDAFWSLIFADEELWFSLTGEVGLN